MKLRVFLTLIFFLVLSTFFKNTSFAQVATDEAESNPPVAVITLATSSSANTIPEVGSVEYDLPYPGLLPDNPLYTLKALRDRIIELLISDPAKKGEFFLLSSDKRFNSGYYLIIKGKNDMGVLYISKSNNYMSMAIAQSTLAGERGKQDLQKMKLSIRKHEEVIAQLKTKVDAKNKTKLSYELDRLKQFALLLKGK